MYLPLMSFVSNLVNANHSELIKVVTSLAEKFTYLK